MKAEINNENKARFFTQYWGQKVLVYPKDNLAGRSGGIDVVGWMISTDVCVNGHLELKPLSFISDEDATELIRIKLVNEGYPLTQITDIKVGIHSKTGIKDKTSIEAVVSFKDWGDSVERIFIDDNMSCFYADFLRSRGYLVPFMGLTCEELIEAGWVRYKE